jgi:hypothetical protein
MNQKEKVEMFVIQTIREMKKSKINYNKEGMIKELSIVAKDCNMINSPIGVFKRYLEETIDEMIDNKKLYYTEKNFFSIPKNTKKINIYSANTIFTLA